MAEYIRRISAAAVLGVALLAGACSGDGERRADSALTQDSALSRDLLLAGAGRDRLRGSGSDAADDHAGADDAAPHDHPTHHDAEQPLHEPEQRLEQRRRGRQHRCR